MYAGLTVRRTGAVCSSVLASWFVGGEGGEEAVAFIGGGGEVDGVADFFFPLSCDDGGFEEVVAAVDLPAR